MINKKITISLMSIAASLAVMGGAAYAAFSDTATSKKNTFGTGTLTLLINGANPQTTGVFTVTNALPGYTEDQVFTLKNNGTVVASTVKVSNIVLTAGGTGANLGPKLSLQFYDDLNSNDVIDGGEALMLAAPLNDSSWSTGVTLSGVSLAGGASKDVKAKLIFDPTSGNSYQNSTLGFNIDFTANQ